MAAEQLSNHPLSLRLSAIYEMVPEGRVLCDVGTDHGWLPINLVNSGKIPGAIAMDLREGPLDRAKEHIRDYHLEDRIQVRQSDGLAGLQPGEAETASISGMGGNVMLHILKSAGDHVNELEELILQPQSEIYEVRKYLHEQNYLLLDEKMVEEEGKFYFLMDVLTPGEALRREKEGQTPEIRKQMPAFWREQGLPQKMCLELGFTFGPVLLMRKDPVLIQYLHHETEVLRGIRESLENGAPGDRVQTKRMELRNREAMTGLAMRIAER